MKKKLLFVIITILLLTAGILGSILIYTRENTSKIAVIYQNGVCIQTIDLNTVTESRTFTIEGDHGASNTIEIRPGEIGIIEASCPDKVCIHMGFIKNNMLPISCLPNGLIIRIEPDSPAPKDDIDAVVR